MFIFRTNGLTRFGVYKNVDDAAVVAQQAKLIDEFLAPAAKLDPDRLRLQPARLAPNGMKWLEKLVREDFVTRLGSRKTDALRWLRPRGGARAQICRDNGHDEKNHGPRLARQQ